MSHRPHPMVTFDDWRARMDLTRKTGLIAGLISGVAFLSRSGPTLSWQDSGELISAAFQLGVPHPTGFAPIMMLAKALALIPLGEVALRTTWLSALSAGVAVGVLAALATSMARAAGAAPWLGCVAGGLVGCGLSFAPTIMQNATALEAYTPSLALLVTMIALAASNEGRPTGRQVCLIALCYGLGASAHVIVRFHGLLPLAAAIWWCQGIPKRRLIPFAIAAGTLGMLATAYVPLASLRDAPLDWGDPETPARLWDHLSGGRIRRAFDGRMLNPAWIPFDAPVLWRLIRGDLGIPLCFLSVVGLIGMIRTRVRVAGLIAVVAVVDAAYCILLNPMGLVDRQVGFPLLAMIALLGGCGVVALAVVRPARWWRVCAVVFGVFAVSFPLVEGLRWSGPEYGPAGLMASAMNLPPRSAVLCTSDNLCGGLLWAQYVEGDRPDVVALPRQHLWDVATLNSRFERHAPELNEEARGGLQLSDAIELLQRSRPVYWERGGDEGELRSHSPDARLVLNAPLPLYKLERGPLGDHLRSPAQTLDEFEMSIQRWYGQPTPPDEYGRAFLAQVLSSLASSVADGGDRGAAQVLLERSYELNPRAAPLLNLSALDVRDGRLGPAWNWIELALEIEPSSLRGLNAAGKLLLAQGRDNSSRRYFEQALRLCPTRCGGPLEGLGILAARGGDYPAAQELLTEALHREPWLEDARTNLEVLRRLEHDGEGPE